MGQYCYQFLNQICLNQICFIFVIKFLNQICFIFVYCERFEPKSHFKSRLSLIIRVNLVLNRTVVDSDWCFDNLCGSHLQSQSELYHLSHVSWWYYTLAIDLIGQLQWRHDVIGCLSVIGAFWSIYCHS